MPGIIDTSKEATARSTLYTIVFIAERANLDLDKDDIGNAQTLIKAIQFLARRALATG